MKLLLCTSIRSILSAAFASLSIKISIWKEKLVSDHNFFQMLLMTAYWNTCALPQCQSFSLKKNHHSSQSELSSCYKWHWCIRKLLCPWKLATYLTLKWKDFWKEKDHLLSCLKYTSALDTGECWVTSPLTVGVGFYWSQPSLFHKP